MSVPKITLYVEQVASSVVGDVFHQQSAKVACGLKPFSAFLLSLKGRLTCPAAEGGVCVCVFVCGGGVII